MKMYQSLSVTLVATLLLGSAFPALGQTMPDQNRLTAQELRDIDREQTAIPGIRYFNMDDRIYQVGQSDGTLGDLPDRTEALIDTSITSTGTPNVNYWDTELKKFFKAVWSGSIENIDDIRKNYKNDSEITTLDSTQTAIPQLFYWDTTFERYCEGLDNKSLFCWTPCIADCSGKECGSDGCGGLCGTCMGDCNAGTCAVPLPTSQLLAYYPFTGNTNDVSGNNYHATNLSSTITSDPFGTTNEAYNLNGSSSRIRTPITQTQLATNNGRDFSLSLWINPDRYSSSYNMVIASNRTGELGFMLSIIGNQVIAGRQTGQLSLLLGGGCDYDQVFSTAKIANNQWVHLIISLNYDEETSQSVVNFYQNGVKMAVNTSGARNCGSLPITSNNNILNRSNVYINSTQPIYLGNDPNAPGVYYFDGQMDEVAIYDRALSADEALAIYEYHSNQ